MHILDTHQHIGVIPDFTRAEAGPGEEEQDLFEFRTRTAVMDRSGITRGIVGPGYQYLMPNGIADTKKVNDNLAGFRDRFPDRFPYAVAAIEPRQGEAALEEVRRVHRDLEMVGVMWHNRLQGCYVDSPWMKRCIGVAAEEGLVPFIHCHHGSLLESPWRLERLAAEFPDTPLLVIDGLSGFEETELFYDISQRRDNVFFDTGMWSGGASKVNAVKRVMGTGRLVFGSGTYSYPMGDRRSMTVDAVRESDLSDTEKAGVFSGNLRRILGVD